MRVYLRHRASHVLLWSALMIAAVSSGGRATLDAQSPPLRWDGLIELISGKYDYPPPTLTPPVPADGPSEMTRHAVSGDGRYVVFSAAAPALGYYDWALYIRDRRISETRILLGPARDGVISNDGRHVAFTLCDQYIRPDQLPICDVWALDQQTSGWTLVSATAAGDYGNADSGKPVLSGTGRFVVFQTAATNLAPGSPAGTVQLVIRDRDADGNGVFDEPGTAVLEIVSAPDGMPGTAAANGTSETAEVSDDGRYVAFRSAAADLVAGDTNGGWDVFRRDRLTHETRRLNLRPYPEGFDESPASVDSPAISMTPDGRYVAFASADPLLAPATHDDTNNALDVFLFDAASPWLERLDVGWGPAGGGYVPGNGPTVWPTLSADGRYVSLQSAATNVQVPPAPGSTHAYVIDRTAGIATRVSVKPDGTEPDRDCVRPSISADGSLVTFVSQAFNLAANVSTEFDRIYAAVHFELAPAEQSVSGSGGTATYTITAQQHTQWWVEWSDWPYWVSIEEGWMGTGSGTVRVTANEANPDPTPRTSTLRVAGQSAGLTQLEGLSLTSVSPSSGPAAGGTLVTITGTGFEPGMRVAFDGADAVTTDIVNSTTIVATTPAHAPGSTYVAVFAPPPDYRSAWINEGFRFTDSTPPEVSYYLNGDLGEDGWYRSDVTLYWWWWDPESNVTSTSGCELRTISTDTAGTTFTCTATSEGGTTSVTATVKRDATPAAATITSPQFRMYETGSALVPAFTCADALSGVAQCAGSSPDGEPLDTLTPGYHGFWVATTDRAGNPGGTFVDYAIGSGVCVLPPSDVSGWWRLEGETRNATSNSSSTAWRVGLTADVYVDGMVGQGYQFEGADGYLQTPFHFSFAGDKQFAIAAWVNPSADTLGTIVRSRESYSVARLANGSLAWAFRKPDVPALAYYDTGVKVPLNVWSHIAVVLDGTNVVTYLNGRVAHAAANIGDVYNAATRPITVGGADDRPDYFKGVLDEVQIVQHALAPWEVEGLFLAGDAGACVPKRTTFEILEPIAASYGSPTYSFDVRLVDETGAPVVGRTIHMESIVGAYPLSTSTAERVTDADGRVHWDAPLKNASRGLYDDYTAVQFDGDSEYVRQYAEPDVLVGKGTPVVTWPAPAAITYSYPVNATQLNAAADVPGTFSYSVAPGTLLPAGTHTLSATFTPDDTGNYEPVTATTTLIVNKATPVLILDTPTWSYSGTPQAAFGAVKDRFGFTIATPTLTYDGSPDGPVMPGSYAVVATFAGNDNYEPASATGTLTITKAVVGIYIFVSDVTYNGGPFGAGVLITGFEPDPLPPDSVTYNGSTSSPVNAGSYTVVATFNGSAIYEPATATATFVIHKATPTVTVNGGTFTYDGAAHPATATVTGGGGIPLGAPVLTYNGSPDAPVTGGTYAVVGSYPGDANHHAATGSATITIDKTWPVVTVSGGTFTYDGQPHPATGTAIGAGGVALNGLTLTYNGSPDVPVNAGGYAVTATYAGDSNYHQVVRYASIQIDRAAAAVTVTGGTFTYDGQPHPAAALVTGAGGIDLGTPTVTYSGSSDAPVNAGTYSALAFFSGDANHESASGSALITIARAAPAIVVNGGTFVYDGQPHPATGSVSGIGGVDLGPLTFTYGGSPDAPIAAGAYTVLGVYNGTANYLPSSRQATITIGKATPAIVVTGGTFTYDMYPHPATGSVTGADGGSIGAPAFTYNGSPFPPSNTGVYDVVGSFAGDANHLAVSGTAMITIQKATPVLTWNQPAAIVYGTPLGGGQLNATAPGVGGVFTYSPAAGTVLDAGVGQPLAVTFTPLDPNNYESATAATAIDVTKAVPAISIAGGTFTYDGLPHPATVSVTGGGGVALGSSSVTYDGSPQPPVNVGSYAVVASYAGDGNHHPASATATVSITKGTAVLSWSTPAAIVYGTPLGAAQLNATANIPGTFAYWPAAGTLLNGGTAQWLSATFTPADTANYHVTSTSTTIDVTRAAPVLDWTAPAAIVYGTPLGAAQLNATANAAGTFTYAPAAGTVLSAGNSQTLTATFTPANANNYTGGSVSTTINVSKAPLAIRANDAVKPFGAPLPIFSAAAAGFVNGDSFASLSGALAFATGATAQSPVGSYAVTPSGMASNNYAITFLSGTLAVVRGGVTVTVTTSPEPSGLNQLMTFTANVDPAAPAAGAPGGTVQFFDGATLLGTSTLSSGGASLTTAGLAAGVHTIEARYDGDPSFEPGASSSPHTVNVAAATPALDISSSRHPASVGQSVTLTATVSLAAGPVTGTVEFYDGAALLGTSPIGSGTASFTTSALMAGSHAITARYLGDANAPPVRSGVFVQSIKSNGWKDRSTSLVLSASPNPSAPGGTVTLTATVTGSSGAMPGGGMLFMVNGEVVGDPAGVAVTPVSGSTASATFVLAGLPGGRHTVTATYLGDSNYRGSTAAAAQTVN